MHVIEQHPILTMWVLWMVVLPLGPLAGSAVPRKFDALSVRVRRSIIAGCCALAACAWTILFTDYSLRGFWTDAIELACAYVALWVLCGVLFSNRVWVQRTLLVLIAVPTFLLALAVYTFVPFGIAMDTSMPKATVVVRPGVVARINQYGFAGNDTDIVDLVKRPTWFPLLEKRVGVYASSDLICGTGRLRAVAEPQDTVRVSCADRPETLKTFVVR